MSTVVVVKKNGRVAEIFDLFRKLHPRLIDLIESNPVAELERLLKV